MRIVNKISIKDDIDGAIVDEHKRLSLRLLIPLVMKTPVDTGRARMNWIVSQKVSTDKTYDIPASAAAGAQFAIQDGTKKSSNPEPYTQTFIQNNLPYIEALNDGHSLQAPSKYIDLIVMRAVSDNG